MFGCRVLSIKRVMALIFLLSLCPQLLAVEEHTGLWTGFVVIGPLQARSEWQYYFDGQLQLLDTPYKLENVYSSLGLGKQLNDKLLVFVSNLLLISKQENTGQTFYEYRLWQEANWSFIDNVKYYLSSRTMLEERKRFSQIPIALRLRERIMFRMPFINWPGHALIFSDELFFNLNRPSWVSNKFYSQNRFFIGIGSNLSKQVSVDIGYLNQYLFNVKNQMNNILFINFNITGKTRYYKG